MILLRLYPRAWRERYEAEMLTLLEEHEITLATRFDLVRGAFDAWQDCRRSVMAPIPPAVGRAAGLGVIPSVVVIATFLLGQALRSQLLVNRMGLAAMPVLFVVCLWAGIRVTTGRSSLRDRLRAGLAAGGSVGLVAGVLIVVVVIGLLLAQVAFGLWVSPVPPLDAPSVRGMAGSLLNPITLLAIVVQVLATTALGAAIGTIGAAVGAILPGHAGHPGQPPTGSET